MIVAFGMPGPTEWIIILAIVLIFFGVGKLPQVLSQMGKGVKAFKDGMTDEEEEEAARKEIDVTPPAPTATAPTATAPTATASADTAQDAEEVKAQKG